MDCNSIASPPAGFPLKIGLRDALGPVDFPPITLDPVLSTYPMVAREGTYDGPVSRFATRPTHDGQIDLLTGGLLYSETDFELPFGSAVFRHIRTHSTYESIRSRLFGCFSEEEYGTAGFGYNPHDWYWDWNGLHWMMGENPILLVDASYPEIGNDSDLQICYFIPDAHHSVPFQKVEGSGYTAPDHFDATMQRRVDENDDVFFDVWVQRGSLKYTFKLYEEDLWEYEQPPDPNDPNGLVETKSVHDPNGHGLPYYALIQSIEDRNGNKIKYHYCEFKQYYDPDWDDPNTPCCEHCQNCMNKGQVTAIELIAGEGTDDEKTAWTLLYTYRQFAQLSQEPYKYCEWGEHPTPFVAPGAPTVHGIDLGSMTNVIGEPDPYQFGTMLHSIHVYEGDLNSIPDCLTLSWENFEEIDSYDDYEDVDEETLLSGALPDNWVIRTRYIYDEPGMHNYHALEDPNSASPVCADTPYRRANNVKAAGYQVGLMLLKTSVTHRENTGDQQSPDYEEVQATDTIYRYMPKNCQPYRGMAGNVSSEWGFPGYGVDLAYVFKDETLKAIVECQQEGSSLYEDLISNTENMLFEIDLDQLVRVPAPPNSDGDYVQQTLQSLADVTARSYKPTQGNNGCSEANVLGHTLEIREMVQELGMDTDLTVIRGSGIRKYKTKGNSSRYEYTNFIEFPPEMGTLFDDPNDWYNDWGDGGTCQWPRIPELNRKYDWPIYRWPYRFYGDPLDDIILAEPNDPWHPFHVVIIDEYGIDPNEVSDPNDPNTPIVNLDERHLSRRCVQMNMAGFIMQDRKWIYQSDGEIEYTQYGYGDEYRYDEHGRKIAKLTQSWSVAFDPK